MHLIACILQGSFCWWVQPGEIYPEKSQIDKKGTAAKREADGKAQNKVPDACNPAKLAEKNKDYDVENWLQYGDSAEMQFVDITADQERFAEDAKAKAEGKKDKGAWMSGTWYCRVKKVESDGDVSHQCLPQVDLLVPRLTLRLIVQIVVVIEPEQPSMGALPAKPQTCAGAVSFSSVVSS